MLLTAAALVIVLAGMKAAQELLVPLAFAALIAIITAPLVLWMQRKRVPSVVAVAVVVSGVAASLIGFGTLVSGSVNAFVAAIPRYQASLNAAIGDYANDLERLGINVSLEGLRTLVDPSAVMDVAGELVTQLASLLSDTVLIVLTVIFILFEVATLPRQLRRAIGDPKADLSRYSALTREVQRYVVIKTIMSIATGVLVGLFTSIMGVDFPLLWALLAFVLNYVPNIGSIIASVPPVILALVQFGLGTAIGVASGFVILNVAIGNVIEPRWLGRKLGLSTLVVFLSLVFWGWLWGPMGMLLSVPLTMIVKILLESSEQFSPMAELMDRPLSQRPSQFPRPERVSTYPTQRY
jgi:AI-2 transport protein TqsA